MAKAEKELNGLSRSIDECIISEFRRFQQEKGYLEAQSCVPSGFVPKRTEDEANEAALGELIADEDLKTKTAEKMASRSGPAATVLPEPGGAVNERTQGFWCMSYPRLFPFGLGCFNEPRAQVVSFDQWTEWVLMQCGHARAPAQLAPNPLSIHDQSAEPSS